MRLVLDHRAVGDQGDHPVDLQEIYAAVERPCPADRPWLMLNMVTSVDGAIADGDSRSGGLSGASDKAIFRVLREAADVVLVGAGTARSENYGPVKLDGDARARRVAARRPALPRLAIVSGRADLDPSSRLFDEPGQRPIVITTRRSARAGDARFGTTAEWLVGGDEHVDLGSALGVLHEHGHRVVLCEGGPTLNANLWRAGLVDEVCLTVSPTIVAGDRHGILTPSGHASLPGDLELAHVIEDDRFLFLRYLTRS